MATHSIMKVVGFSTKKDENGNEIPTVLLKDFEPRTFTVKLSKATPDQKAALAKLKGKNCLIPTSEGAMNGAFWMSLKEGSVMALPSA